MTTSRPSLPEYAHPPLVAATLGVTISRAIYVDDISPALLNEYQQRLGPEWGGVWTHLEGFEPNFDTDFGISNYGHQLQNVLGDRIIRLNTHSFGFTWRGTEHKRYPRYENLRDGFVAAWDMWCEVHSAFSQHPACWRVRYLNQIPQGTVWQSSNDWTFFRMLAGVPDLIKQVTSVRLDLKVPDLQDELEINWVFDHAVESSSLPCIWLRLTAHGAGGKEASSILDGMDAGRAAIVKTFSDLLSPAANAYWGLRRRET